MKRLFGLLFTLCIAAMGQPRGGFFPWWESPITRDLNLSQEQTEKIHTIVSEYRSRLIDDRAAVEKAEGDMQDLFNADNVDDSKAKETVDRLVAARSALTRSFTEMSLKLRQVLTINQWRQLEKRRPKGPSFRTRPRGRGEGREGPSGPPRSPRPPQDL
jgi:Spy/CpxP family protein refolding chaperone